LLANVSLIITLTFIDQYVWKLGLSMDLLVLVLFFGIVAVPYATYQFAVVRDLQNNGLMPLRDPPTFIFDGVSRSPVPGKLRTAEVIHRELQSIEDRKSDNWSGTYFKFRCPDGRRLMDAILWIIGFAGFIYFAYYIATIYDGVVMQKKGDLPPHSGLWTDNGYGKVPFVTDESVKIKH
jgi:hypothetical protein